MFYPVAGRFNLPHHFLKIAAGLLCLILPGAALAQTVNLTVNATQTVRTVDERVFGVNAVMWDPQTSSAQTISLVQAAGIRTIRIPGGSASDDYHWRVNKSAGTSNGGNNTWTWPAGFNSFSSLIANVGTQAFVTVNYGSGTAEEAAAWVAYANASISSNVAIGVDANGYDWKTAGYWASLRAASPISTDDGMNFLRIGRSAPFGLKYWEIGNECYGSWENDTHAAKWDPVTYANTVNSYSAKMKAVDSTIKIGAVAETGEDTLDGMSPVHNVTNPRTNASHHGWTPVMLATFKSASYTPNFLIYHRYEQAPNAESDAGLLQTAKTWPNDATNLRQMLGDYLSSAGAGVELCVTENNSVYTSPGKQSTSLVNGLYMADSIGNVLQTEFNSLVWWDIRNGPPTISTGTGSNTVVTLDGNMSASLYGWRQYGDYGMLSTPTDPANLTPETTYYDAYPTYYMMKLLSHFARNGDTVVKTTSSDSLVSVFAAHRADGTLSVLVINKTDPRITPGAKSVNFTLTGFNPASTANVFSYGVTQDNAAQSGGSGAAVDVASSTMSISGATFSASFASYSATVISLSPAAANVAPSFTLQPSSQTVTVGSPVTFTATATGTPTPTYQWQKNGVNIGGATSSSYTINHVQPGDASSYRVVATNTAGSVNSTAAVLTVKTRNADFNGDGQADIVWENAATGERGIWLMVGSAVVNWASLPTIPTDWHIVGTGDFNGDGQTDIVWENVTTGERGIWLMVGSAVVNWATLPTVPTDWHIVGTGDFNGDGQTDIVWENVVTGERGIWLMVGSAVVNWATLPTVPTDWHIVGTDDFNGDGQIDIVWENAVTGERGIWLMSGSAVVNWASLPTIPTDWHIVR
jgi:alpha-L-arabinofuranosidase